MGPEEIDDMKHTDKDLSSLMRILDSGVQEEKPITTRIIEVLLRCEEHCGECWPCEVRFLFAFPF